MGLLSLPKRVILKGIRLAGYRLERADRASSPPPEPTLPGLYEADGIRVWCKNIGFLTDERYERAYQRGMMSGHRFGSNLDIRWRIAVTVWAASHGTKLPGDFVECGVNTGIFSLAICDYVDFNSTGKTFYLFDTFRGIPQEQITQSEEHMRGVHANYYSEDCYALVQKNFAPFSNVKLVRGPVPDTLTDVPIENVAYLSIDMNIAYPEKAALDFFWPKLVTGALVVLDDYAWHGHEAQRDAVNDFARRVGATVLTLPTGQGLMIKAAN
jgi:O-methyltransferase